MSTLRRPGLQQSKSTGKLDSMSEATLNREVPVNNKSNKTKFGLLIRTPRRRRACENQKVEDIFSKSWDGSNNPGKSTWSGWRSLRKISDTLIDYALNEPYKPDSVFDDETGLNSSEAVYRRKCEFVNDAVVRKLEPTNRKFTGSRTIGHAEGNHTIQRLASYERYFQDLLCETTADHPDYDDLQRARDKSQELVKKCEEEVNQLDRIQDLFPNDQLYLHDKDALTLKMKGLMRKRSTTAARLQRAFSSKSTRSTSASGGSGSSQSDCTDGTPVSSRMPEKRHFIMETAATFTTGVQSQDRHLFLFNDLLLVAKARSGGNFKLKEKVRVSELWLAHCIDDVAEVNKCRETSFVLGWPTTNVVVTFSSAAVRDLWWNKLSQLAQEERDKEPRSTTVQIAYHDALQGIEYFKTLSVSSTETAKDCIRLVLSHLEMSNQEASNFRLWIKTLGDESPYPLIGHEYPFAIKMNCVREYMSTEEGFDLDHCNNVYSAEPANRCQFILRSVQKPVYPPDVDVKAKAKAKKSPNKIQLVFRRVQSKPDSLDGVGSPSSSGVLFAQPLNKICLDNRLPAAITEMLAELWDKGPHTVGIFRKSANARQVRELRERLDASETVDWSLISAVVVAVVFKDFLRSLPDCLLVSALYDKWLEAAAADNPEATLNKIKTLCERLPSANLLLLRHFLCVLVHISKHCSQNMMSSTNLAVCVGPSLLWANHSLSSDMNPALVLSAEATASKQVPALVSVLIDKCADLFGVDTLRLFGNSGSSESPVMCKSNPQQQQQQQRSERKVSRNRTPVQKQMAKHGILQQHDSGNEESDSLHSVHHSDVLRRDDSSIDSLERELLGDHEVYDTDSGLHLRRDKMSVTNLSRDSGLTLSDTQLYTPDEEEGSESSSSGRGSDKVRDALKQRPGARAPEPRSLYAPVYAQSASRYDIYGLHGKLVPSYSSGYNSSYDQRSDVYRKLSDDAVYAVPKATPTVILHEEYEEGSPFQRQDWFRRKSHTRKQGQNGTKFDSVGASGLRRSASDESLPSLNHMDPPEIHLKKPVNHRKGPAPLPPSQIDPAELSRSKSVANVGGEEQTDTSATVAGKDSHNYRTSVRVNAPAAMKLETNPSRSQSTPHIDEVDRSYDSSTLSDDDSTPHVSRSNSRGKDYNAVNSAWESAYGALSVPVAGSVHIIVSQDGSGSIIYPAAESCKAIEEPPRVPAKKSSEPKRDTRSVAGDTRTTWSHRSSASDYNEDTVATGSRHGTPDLPTYEEALSRRRYPSSANPAQWTSWKENANLVQVRASPVRLNSQESWSDEPTSIPPPLPPKTDPPPLPPKQRIHMRTNPFVSPSKTRLHPATQAENAPKSVDSHLRMRSRTCATITRTRPVTIHMDASILHDAGVTTTEAHPPSLPPKERNSARKRGTNVSVVAIENNYAPLHRSFAFSTNTLRHAMEEEDPSRSRDQEIQTSGHWLSFCETETQTSLSPQPSEASDDNESRPGSTESSAPGPCERKGRSLHRGDTSSLHRSHSLPPLDKPESESDSDDVINVQEKSKPSTKTSQVMSSSRKPAEISWSVSQLRAIFAGQSASSSSSTAPPPYRHPPTHRYKSHAQRERSSSTESFGEESYV